MGLLPGFPETPLTPGILLQGRKKLGPAKIRPSQIREVQLRIRELPEEEIRQSLLTAGSDQ